MCLQIEAAAICNTQWLTFVSFSQPLRLPSCSQSVSQSLSTLSALTSVHSWTISLTATLHASTAQYVGVITCLRRHFLFSRGSTKTLVASKGRRSWPQNLPTARYKCYFNAHYPGHYFRLLTNWTQSDVHHSKVCGHSKQLQQCCAILRHFLHQVFTTAKLRNVPKHDAVIQGYTAGYVVSACSWFSSRK
jgi:hypothetical protein